MKRKISKLLIILLIFQMIICFSNIHVVSAGQNMDTAAEKFYKTGSKKVSSLGISMDLLMDPILNIFVIIQFIAIFLTTGWLLLTCIALLRNESFNKAQAKRMIGIRLFCVFLAVAGVPWGIRLLRILLPIFVP